MPELLIMPLAAARHVGIVDIEWSGLRVRLRAEGASALIADLKLGAEGEGPSIADKAREVDADGRTSLLVPDDILMGKPALLELRDPSGQVLATRGVTVGGS